MTNHVSMLAGAAAFGCMAGALALGRLQLKRWSLWSGKTGTFLAVLAVVIFPAGGYLMLQYGYHPLKILRYWVLMYGLVLLGILDVDRKRIPNRALVILLAVRTLLLAGDCAAYPELWAEILVSAAVGLLGGTILFLVPCLLSRKGIGMGDVKLVGTAGYYLGFQALMSSLIVTMVLTLLAGVGGLLLRKVSWKTELPFAPFAAAGTIIALLAGC